MRKLFTPIKTMLASILILSTGVVLAQTQLTTTTPYSAQLISVNGKLAWKYADTGADQGLVTFDPATRTQTNYFDDLRDIVNLTSYGDFAISRASDIGGGTGQGMLMTDGESFEILINYNQQGEANFVHNDIIYQVAKRDEIGTTRSGNGARKIWAYSLKTETGEQMTDLNSGAADLGNGNFKRVAPFGDGVFLGIRESTNNLHVPYLADGDPSNNTSLSSDANTQDEPFLSINESLVLFIAASATDALGVELYKYDGTSVQNVEEIRVGSTGTNLDSQIGYNAQIGFVHNGYGYFTGPQTDGTGIALYRSNGTSIELVKLFTTSSDGTFNNGSTVNFLAPVSDTHFVFRANDVITGTAGQELWVSDGTPGGTSMIMDINSGTTGSSITGMKPVDGGAIFWATDGTDEGVYFTDGTISGTYLISDVSLHNGVKALVAIGSRAYFFDDSNDLFELPISATGTTNYTTSWDNSTPTSSTNAIVDGALVVGSSSVLEVQNLEVAISASITVESGSTLVVGGDIFNEGTITVESGGSLITEDGEYLIGNDVSATRRTTFDEGTGQYSVVGSPMTEATTTALGASAKVYSYNESAASFVEMSAGTAMEPGVGYFSTFTGDADGDITFTGTPNTGDIEVDLTSASSATTDGYNLVANPYLAAISLSQLAADNLASIDGNFYIWDDNNPQGTTGSVSDYITVNTSGVVTGSSDNGRTFDGNVRSGQGFFVKANSASTLVFNEDQIVVGSNTDDNFFRTATTVDFTRFKVAMESASGYNETLVAFRDNASDGFDRGMDGLKFGNNALQLFSYIDDERYAIQTLNADQLTNARLELGALIPVNGIYSFSLREIENIPTNMEVVLIDQANAQEYVLSNTAVQIQMSASADAKRFSIELRAASVLAVAEFSSNISVFKADSRINLIVQEEASEIDVAIFSLSGQLIHLDENAKLQNQRWSAQVNLREGGLYIMKVQTNGSVFTQKFIY